jgi:hypothetical protein
VAYLSIDSGVLASCFYFVAHMACYCMSAIHLSGIVWINCLYASVSVSCESMIGCTADLGKCLYDAEFFYMLYACLYEGVPCVGNFILW